MRAMTLTIELPMELAHRLGALPEEERNRFAIALMRAGAAQLTNPDGATDGGDTDEVTWLESLPPLEQDALLTSLLASLPSDSAADSHQGRPARFLAERAHRLHFMAAMGSKFKQKFRPYRALGFAGVGAGSPGAVGDDVQGHVDRLREGWGSYGESENRGSA
jgi:hypothetical protein